MSRKVSLLPLFALLLAAVSCKDDPTEPGTERLIDQLDGSTPPAVVISSIGAAEDLGSLVSNGFATAFAINSAGTAVGGALASDGREHPFIRPPGGPMHDLGGFGRATAINDAGIIAGYGPSPTTGLDRPFRIVNGTREELSIPGLPNSDRVWVFDMNASGTIVGYRVDNTGSGVAAGYWTADGTWHQLTPLSGAIGAEVRGINDAGDIVGGSRIFNGSVTTLVPTVWPAGGAPVRIPVASNANSAVLMDISNSGVIVGGHLNFFGGGAQLLGASVWLSAASSPSYLGFCCYARGVSEDTVVVGDGNAWSPQSGARSLGSANYTGEDIRGGIAVGWGSGSPTKALQWRVNPKLDQLITFDPLGNKTFGDPDFNVSATASSGLPVSFAFSGKCTVTGTTVHLTGAGSCNITARQSGNNSYNPAPDVTRTFEIAKGQATLAVDEVSLTQSYDGTAKAVTVATSPANLTGVTVSYSQDGEAVTSPMNAGSYAFLAKLTNDDYQADDLTGTMIIRKVKEVRLTWATPADISYGTPLGSAQLNATASYNGNPVAGTFVYDPSAGTRLSAGQGQTLRVVFTPTDQTNYDDAAASVQINVLKADQQITFGPLGDKRYGDPDFTLTGGASSGLALAFSAEGSCSIAGNMVKIMGAGSCTVTAQQGGDENYNPAQDVARSFTIAKGTATLALGNLEQTYDATARSAAATTEPANLSGVAVTYDGQPNLPINASSYAVVAKLTNPNYEAPDANGTLTVKPATPAIDWPAPSSMMAGTALSSAQLNAVATDIHGNPLAGGTYVYTPAAGTKLEPSATQTLTVDYTPSNANYKNASKSVQIAVLYQFTGFFQPVDNGGVLNKAKAGSAIPIKFSLAGNQGLDILQSGSPSVGRQNCTAGPSDLIEETVTANASGLTYDATADQYVYVWKTGTTLVNTCQKFVLITKDGVRHEALFQFTK